jgi:aminoglycoside phosphotransferase (APT) family kinase protein
VRQPKEDRALYYRQLRETLGLVVPELSTAQAIDAVGLVDRILAEFIVEEEWDDALSAEFGAQFEELLSPRRASSPVTPAQFDELRARAAHAISRSGASNDPRELERSRALVDVERSFVERLDEIRREILADRPVAGGGPKGAQSSVSPEQLTGYLRGRLDDPGLTVTQLSVVPGGRSKETILVNVSGTDALPPEVILRKDRPVGLLQTRAADEFAVIKAVYEYGGVPVPRPFFAEEKDHGLGEGTFLVMECVPGHKAGEFFPDLAAPADHRHELGLHLAEALGRLHTLPLDRLDDSSLSLATADVTEESVLAAVEGMVARIDELTGPPCASVPMAAQWLRNHGGDVVPSGPLCLLQGDFGFHNMLVDGARITALVDWEAATIGPAARELAAAWHPVHALMDWGEFVEAYLEAGGLATAADARAVNYYRVLVSLGGFMTSKMGGHLFRTGSKRDILTAHSGLDSRLRCERNLAWALDDAMTHSG